MYKNLNNILIFKIFLFLLIININIIIIFYRYKNNKNIILNINKNISKKYNISKYNKIHFRYNFHDTFKKRELFIINYSYIPYLNINNKIPYDENAELLYQLTGILNITKLDFFYYKNISSNYNDFNHIHLASSFDKKYIYASSVTLASILNTSNSNTYIHFHLIILDSKFKDMKKLIQLKKINQNIEFIFYNGKQAIYDFGSRNKHEIKGIGDYSRMLLPEIVNNTDKLLIIDSGDILVQKDLSEVYFFNLEDYYFAWTLEYFAGNPKTWNKFSPNKFYPNIGVCLVNVSLFRQDRLYEKAFYTSMAYNYLQCPYQEIFFFISTYRFKFFPLNYNCKIFYDNDQQILSKINNTKYINFYRKYQKYSPFNYTLEEINDASFDPVIIHIYHEKIFLGNANKKYTIQWLKYANLSGFYKQLKILYPKPFQIFKI